MALKGANLALVCMNVADWSLNTVNILGICFLYNKKTQNEENVLKQITEKALKKFLSYDECKI